MTRERTDGRAVFNGLQALSVVSAIIAILILAIVLNLLLKQVWPDAGLASYLCIWWSLGVILVNWRCQNIDWPAANKFDFVAGLRVVRVATLWPRYMSNRS